MSVTSKVVPVPVLAIVVVGCLLSAAPVWAQGPVATELFLPVDRQVVNPVSGELVRLWGRVRVAGEVTLLAGGAQVKLTVNVDGGGTGQTSGAAYRLVGSGGLASNIRGPLPSDVQVLSQARLSGPRAQDTLMVDVHLQATVNNNGKVVAILRDIKTSR
ncbi:MAG: hypothetical protein HYR60_21700 [Acidobacteria bacterium]|nr:hypothetical protein [Acidobacteriota bacterium]